MDETDASLACVCVQLLTSHPSRTTACLGSSDFTREGSVARIVSPEYGKPVKRWAAERELVK